MPDFARVHRSRSWAAGFHLLLASGPDAGRPAGRVPESSTSRSRWYPSASIWPLASRAGRVHMELVPDRIAMRLGEPERVDMVLGDAARDRGKGLLSGLRINRGAGFEPAAYSS
jgi:hypothetical protein